MRVMAANVDLRLLDYPMDPEVVGEWLERCLGTLEYYPYRLPLRTLSPPILLRTRGRVSTMGQHADHTASATNLG